MDSIAVWELDDALKKQDGDARRISPGTVSDVDDQGVIWVRLVGSDEDTPVTSSTASVDKGDVVNVRIEGGRAWIDGSTSNPSASTSELGDVSAKAIQALQDAATAALAAADAQTSAGMAADAAHDAQESADSAAEAAGEAWDKAESAETAANAAQSSAAAASSAAATADAKAVQASAAAAVADGKAGQAISSAAAAQASADAAQADATRANAAASSALVQLSVVEDVAGTLAWINEHGSYEPSEDSLVVDGKVYFEHDGTDYVPIASPDPTANPSQEGWYELDIADSQTEYIMAHLAVTSRGLWVLPSGLGSGTTPASGESQDDSDARQASDYKVLLAADGMYLYDGNGVQVVKYGSTITFDTSRGFAIGDTSGTSYIAFTPSGGVVVGGGVTMGGSATLAEVLAELTDASQAVSNTLIYDHTYEYNAARTQATFTAHLYRGGEDVHAQYDPSAFTWYRKNEDSTVEEYLGSGYTVTVSLADMGYGSHIVGKFTTTDDAELMTRGGDALQSGDGGQMTVRTESGDSIRITDLEVASVLYGTDKLLVSGAEDEHLVTVATLQAYLESSMTKQVRFGTTAQWDAQASLVSEVGTIYIYTDHAADQYGNVLAGVKVGDGNAYLIDLPFTDSLLTAHLADTTAHVTAAEREFWNNKVRAYYTGVEQLVLTTS